MRANHTTLDFRFDGYLASRDHGAVDPYGRRDVLGSQGDGLYQFWLPDFFFWLSGRCSNHHEVGSNAAADKNAQRENDGKAFLAARGRR